MGEACWEDERNKDFGDGKVQRHRISDNSCREGSLRGGVWEGAGGRGASDVMGNGLEHEVGGKRVEAVES